MNIPVIIIGAGGHTKVLIDMLLSCKVKIVGIVDAAKEIGYDVLGIPVIGDDSRVYEYSPSQILLVNGIGSVASTKNRQMVYERFKNKGYAFISVIHPAATIARGVELGEGTQVMAGAVIQPGTKIGANSILNTRSSVDHDCIIGDHVHIAPGVVLSGGVTVGQGAHIGTGVSVIQGIIIGTQSTVAAGATVVGNIPDRTTVAGVPARMVK